MVSNFRLRRVVAQLNWLFSFLSSSGNHFFLCTLERRCCNIIRRNRYCEPLRDDRSEIRAKKVERRRCWVVFGSSQMCTTRDLTEVTLRLFTPPCSSSAARNQGIRSTKSIVTAEGETFPHSGAARKAATLSACNRKRALKLPS